MQQADDEPRAGPALRTVSGASDGGTAAVGASLQGLVSAVDELKRSMGLGEQVDLSEIEGFIMRLRTENDEFRQYAEQAIVVRRRRSPGGLSHAAHPRTLAAARHRCLARPAPSTHACRSRRSG